MKPHYFDQEEPDDDDLHLAMAVHQGYVPPRCLLGGMAVMSEVGKGLDPCGGCYGQREKCAGRQRRDERYFGRSRADTRERQAERASAILDRLNSPQSATGVPREPAVALASTATTLTAKARWLRKIVKMR